MTKVVKLFHIVTASIVLGADVTLLILGIAALGSASSPELYVAAHLIVRWLLGPMAMAALISGVMLAWQMGYSLAGVKWISAKLAITAFLTTLVYVALEPGLAMAAASISDHPGARFPAAIRWRYAIVPAVASAFLIANVTLAVFNARSGGERLRRGGGS